MHQLIVHSYAAWGLLVGLLLGFIGVWRLRCMRGGGVFIPRARRRNSVLCLMCGRRSLITSEEREQALLVCRCGQPLLLVGPRRSTPRKGSRPGCQPS